MKNVKDMMSRLGWSQVGDDVWTKGQSNVMSLEAALLFELNYLKALRRIVHVCPDCGYNLSIEEFSRSEE